MTSYDSRAEPCYDEKNGHQLLVIDPETHFIKLLKPGEFENWYGDKRTVASMMSLLYNHQKDWEYPSEIHPFERLSTIGGREQFSVLDGDYVERLSIVSERIMRYFDEHVRLYGDFDAELLATFIIGTYFMDIFEYAPRLLIRGGTGSGKTKVLKICRDLCYRGNLTGDTTEASMFRMIDEFSITPMLDEYQDYDVATKNSIKKILKNGIMRGLTVQRAEKLDNNRTVPRSYEVFAPVIYVNQAGGKALPEEVVNRSVSITMICRNDVTLPIKPDYKELEEIRNELYTIKWLWLSSPNIVRFDEIHENALEELQSLEGVELDGERIRFSSRCRDILGTMYAVAKMCGNERAILRYFKDMQEVNADEERDSNLGKVFAAIMDLIEKQEEYELFKGHEYELLTKITTNSIARRYEELKSLSGELAAYERVETRSVTNMLKDMGFRLKTASHNMSVINPIGLKVAFLNNLQRYGSKEQIEAFKHELTVRSASKRDEAVNPMCQDSEEVNRLTRTRGD